MCFPHHLFWIPACAFLEHAAAYRHPCLLPPQRLPPFCRLVSVMPAVTHVPAAIRLPACLRYALRFCCITHLLLLPPFCSCMPPFVYFYLRGPLPAANITTAPFVSIAAPRTAWDAQFTWTVDYRGRHFCLYYAQCHTYPPTLPPHAEFSLYPACTRILPATACRAMRHLLVSPLLPAPPACTADLFYYRFAHPLLFCCWEDIHSEHCLCLFYYPGCTIPPHFTSLPPMPCGSTCCCYLTCRRRRHRAYRAVPSPLRTCGWLPFLQHYCRFLPVAAHPQPLCFHRSPAGFATCLLVWMNNSLPAA